MPSSTTQIILIEDFYVEHNSWLNKWLSRKVGSSSDAADLTHDTFIKVMLKNDLSFITEPRAYLTTIAHRLMVNHVRRNKIEQVCMQAIAELPEALVPSPETIAISIETLVRIDEMLDGLPKNVRHAFLLCQLEGISHAEIAKRLSVSVSSVRQYMAKALAHCIAIHLANQ